MNVMPGEILATVMAVDHRPICIRIIQQLSGPWPSPQLSGLSAEDSLENSVWTVGNLNSPRQWGTDDSLYQKCPLLYYLGVSGVII